MCLLGVSLISTPEGVRVIRLADTSTFVSYDREELCYAYQWHIPEIPRCSVNSALLKQARELVTHHTHTDVMDTHNLHCTSHFSHNANKQYENMWLGRGETD